MKTKEFYSVSEGIALAVAPVAARKAWPGNNIRFQVVNLRAGPVYARGGVVREDDPAFAFYKQGLGEKLLSEKLFFKRTVSVRFHDLGIVEVSLSGEYNFTWVGGNPTVHWEVERVVVREWDGYSENENKILLKEVASFDGSQL